MRKSLEKNYEFSMSVLALAFLGFSVLFVLYPYLERRLYEVATGPEAQEFSREIELSVQVLTDLDTHYGACAPETTRGLQALLENSRFFNFATIDGKNETRCSVVDSSKRNMAAPALSWDDYSIGVNEVEVERTLSLPFWLVLCYQDTLGTAAPRWWEVEKKALIYAVKNSGVYVMFDTRLFLFFWGLIFICPILWLMVMGIRMTRDVCYDKSQARLIKQLLKNDKIELQYQPIVDLENGNWVGAEALLRCVDVAKDTYYPPSYIVEIAEIHDCSRQLFREVCTRVASDFSKYFWALDSFYVTINVTSANLSQPDCASQIEEIFSGFNIPFNAIAFEVTERTLVCDQTAIDNLFQLKNLGFSIALDDFGTGYCGLQYLERFPVDVIKLDASFVRLERSPMITYAGYLAKLKDITVIAEGVETLSQRHELLKEGISLGQGWFYHPATPPSKFVRKYFTLHQRDVVFFPL